GTLAEARLTPTAATGAGPPGAVGLVERPQARTVRRAHASAVRRVASRGRRRVGGIVGPSAEYQTYRYYIDCGVSMIVLVRSVVQRRIHPNPQAFPGGPGPCDSDGPGAPRAV